MMLHRFVHIATSDVTQYEFGDVESDDLPTVTCNLYLPAVDMKVIDELYNTVNVMNDTVIVIN